MRAMDACVLHVADEGDDEALETLCRTTEVLASVGVEQVLLVLARGRQAELIWSAALGAEVRALRLERSSPFGKIRALQDEIGRLAREKSLHAVHLHGLRPCLLGSRALKGCTLHGRVLYSPHLAPSASRWSAALLGRLLVSQLEPLECAAVTASLTEAQTLSRLFNRSAEVLPHAVGAAFFAAVRAEDTRVTVLADGCGAEAVSTVCRLSVLLNGREARVPICWLGAADARVRVQLDAAGVQALTVPDDAERAHALSRATAFLHLSPPSRLPLAAAQAMAAAVPCLVSDTPGHRALVRHGETGFVCTSERDFLEKLVILLRDRDERARLGEAARADAERCFALRHFERAVLRAYGLAVPPAPPAAPGASAPAARAARSSLTHRDPSHAER